MSNPECNPVKTTTNKSCVKCGCSSYSNMWYDPMQDTLKITCERCGYAWRKDPLDKKRSDDEV